MQLAAKDMNETYAKEILSWKYRAPYDFYNNETTPENVKEMLGNHYHAVVNQLGELVAYYCVGNAAQVPVGRQFGVYNEDYFDIGIGVKPDWTGKGYGSHFFSAILSFIKNEANKRPIRLTVASVNQRAIRLYQRFGFEQVTSFQRDDTIFLIMILGPKIQVGLVLESCDFEMGFFNKKSIYNVDML